MIDGTASRPGFELVENCLWCASRDLAPCVTGVLDWFYGAMDGEFAFDLCNSCASLVLRERPGPERIAEAYQGYYTRAGGNRPRARNAVASIAGRVLRSAFGRHHHGPRGTVFDAILALPLETMPGRRLALHSWHRFLPKTHADVLDYGCGNGDFLQRAASLGHRVTGVDFDGEALAIAASRGFEVHDSRAIDDRTFAGRFDHISANHVIEHVPDPSELLGRFRAWLKPGGQLYLECPNAGAKGFAHFGSFWRGLEAPRHFSLPSRSTLERALREAGFARVEWHDRKDVRADMAAQSRAAGQLFASFEPRLPITGTFDGPEFLTVLAHSDG